ncbi:MAG: DUF6266 family protein [Bacteroidales bacterium]
MAQIDNLFDAVRGSAGNLVFYERNGRNFMRTKPGKYRDRKSQGQLAQRQRMQVVNRFLKPFGRLIRITFAGEAKERSALQAAQSYNMRHALAGDYPGIGIDPGRVLLSKGPVGLPQSASASVHPEGLLIQWQNGPEGAGNDSLVVMASWGDGAWCEYRFTETLRNKGEYTWQTTQPVTPDALPDVWIAFRNSEMTEMSDSLYAPEKV